MIASIKSVAVHLPERIITNEEIESKINFPDTVYPNGLLGKLLGVQTRRFAEKEIQVSDLAAFAGKKILDQNPGIKIDFMIFAAASSDLIEPATANIIQNKLGLKCPVMDVKNACNSVVSAIQVAAAFIASDIYKNILIVNGEKLSEVINFNPKDNDHLVRCMAGYCLGDAGTALLIGEGTQGNILLQEFGTWGEYWNLCTVQGGGSLAFRDPEKYYFEGNAKKMWDVIAEKGPPMVAESLKKINWLPSEINCLISHQVSGNTMAHVAKYTGINPANCIHTFVEFGNTAAATIPLALHQAMETGKLKPGDKLMIIGFAAGLSFSVQLIQS